MGLFTKQPSDEFVQYLIKDERILAWANHSGGKVFATNYAFLSFDQHENLRLPWEFMLTGKWSEPLLEVTSQIDFEMEPQTRAWLLDEPGKIPDTVRERISDAQVFDQVHDVSGVGKVRFIARKGSNGITWTTIVEQKIDSNSQAHINLELSEIRKSLGI